MLQKRLLSRCSRRSNVIDGSTLLGQRGKAAKHRLKQMNPRVFAGSEGIGTAATPLVFIARLHQEASDGPLTLS